MKHDNLHRPEVEQSRTDTQHYTSVAKLLHWLIAGLVITNFILAKIGENAGDADRLVQQLALLANHKSLGLTLLALVALRLIWRLTHTPPPLPAGMTAWQRHLSTISHWGLYVLLIALPVSGWVMASASTYGLSWFNLFEVPTIVAENAALKDRANEIHSTLSDIIFVVVVLHVIASLYHHFFVKDNVLRRMVSAPVLIVFGLTLIGTLYGSTAALRSGSSTAVQVDTQNNTDTRSDSVTQEISNSSLKTAVWNIDYDKSKIVFSGKQAGARFTGEWLDWNAQIQFIPKPAQTYIDVTIATAKVSTKDNDRDAAMLESDWFNVENFQAARFVLTEIEVIDHATDQSSIDQSSPSHIDPIEFEQAQVFRGDANLTIKAHTVKTPFIFRVVNQQNTDTLVGTARLDRLAFGLGLGEWADTEWIGQYVDVEVLVVATK